MVFSFLRSESVRYGVLIDIGSGSVLTAIVRSDSKKTHPEIVWSKREYTPLRNKATMADTAKSVMTSLINALMALDGEGRNALYEKTKQQKIQHLQVTISAPWACTVTKTISYKNETPFEITEEIIEELIRTAEKKVTEEMNELEKMNDNNLVIVTKNTLRVLANGYATDVRSKQLAQDIKLFQASVAVQKNIISAISDAKEKIFPALTIFQSSFILAYYFVISELSDKYAEYCIVDITYEATEIGIIRDGILTYTSHIPFGAFSLARELASVLNVPLEEASEIEKIFTAYEKKLTLLFSETGDSLAIPKKIYIHANFSTEEFFTKKILSSASSATKMHHIAIKVTNELLSRKYSKEIKEEFLSQNGDTALLISAQFFHTKEFQKKFIAL